jgi:epsilon-lactone hydrolase
LICLANSIKKKYKPVSFSLRAFKYFFKSAQSWRARRNPTIEQTNALIERLTRLDLPSKLLFEYRLIEGINCAVVDSEQKDTCILYLHGGGFGLCSISSHYRFVKYLADATKAPIIFPEYSKIPHALYPTQLNECLAVYNLARKEFKNLILMGDSAGGNLAAAITQHFATNVSMLPNKVVMLSPWLDLSGTEIANNEVTSDVVFRAEEVNHYASVYVGSHNAQEPGISPLYGKYPQAIPTLLLATQDELFFPMIKSFCEKNNHSSIKLIERKGLLHVWPLFVGLMPEATRDARLIAEFCLIEN